MISDRMRMGSSFSTVGWDNSARAERAARRNPNEMEKRIFLLELRFDIADYLEVSRVRTYDQTFAVDSDPRPDDGDRPICKYLPACILPIHRGGINRVSIVERNLKRFPTAFKVKILGRCVENPLVGVKAHPQTLITEDLDLYPFENGFSVLIVHPGSLR